MSGHNSDLDEIVWSARAGFHRDAVERLVQAIRDLRARVNELEALAAPQTQSKEETGG